MFVALDQTFAAFAHVSRPYIQETIEKGPPTLDTVNAGLPEIKPFLHDSARFFTALQAGAKALAETSPIDRRSAARRDPGAERLAGAQQPAAADRRSAGRLPESAEGVFTGLDLLTDTNKNLEAAAAGTSPRRRPPATTSTLAFRNLANASSQGNELRQLAQLHLLRAAGRPEQRGRPGVGARPTARTGRTTCTTTPTRTPAAPGQTSGCEAGNEKYAPGKTVIGNVPGNHGTERPAADEPESRGKQGMSRLPERDTRRRRRSAASSGGRCRTG